MCPLDVQLRQVGLSFFPSISIAKNKKANQTKITETQNAFFYFNIQCVHFVS